MLRAFPPVYSPVPASALMTALLSAAAPGRSSSHGVMLPGQRFEGRNVLLTNSGTTALTLALSGAFGDSVGDAKLLKQLRIVALPAYGCPDLGTAAIAAQCRIRLYDTDPNTLAPDWESVRSVLREGCTHLVVAHLLGRVIDMPQAQALADEYGATLIEDAAQGAGGVLNGRPAGSLAATSVVSFGRGKGLNAGGGGALSLDVAKGSDHTAGFHSADSLVLPEVSFLRSLRDVAAVAAAEVLSQPLLYWLPARLPALGLGKTQYKPPAPASAPSPAIQRLIIHALNAEPMLVRERQQVERWYYSQLGDNLSILVAAPLRPEQSGALRFPVRIAPTVGAALTGFGVARSYPRTLLEYPEILPFIESSDTRLSGAHDLAASLHTLPTHGLLRESDRLRLVRALAESVHRHQ